jgi:hypothetical protein
LIALFVCLSMSATAEVRSFGALHPLSVDRSGVFAKNTSYAGHHATADDGTVLVNFVYPFSMPTQGVKSFALDAGRLLAILTVTRTEKPYDGVQRLYVTTVDSPRARAVRH